MSEKAFQYAIDPASLEIASGTCIAGDHQAQGLRFGLAVGRFNLSFTKALADQAVQTLIERGADKGDITVVWVPGSYETPYMIRQMADQGRYHALIALGVVIEGETPHAQLIGTSVCNALSEESRRSGIPVIDGVVVTHTVEQAAARCTGRENRGQYAALAAIETARAGILLKGS